MVTQVFGQVTIAVRNSHGIPQHDLPVYAFDGASYTGFNATTNSSGQATLTLPEGSYRFRSDKNGLQYWSSTENSCTIPGCSNAAITVPVFGDVTITVASSRGTAQSGLPVYAFDGTTYTGFSSTTDSSGQATLTLPEGNYRFRSDKNNLQYWSSAENACTVPSCTTSAVSIPVFGDVTITVTSSGVTPQSGLPVYVFDGATYTGFNATTNSSGQATLTLPEGNYRFRSDKNALQYWSSSENQCSVPDCCSASSSPRSLAR